jgi:hypothetical protein
MNVGNGSWSDKVLLVRARDGVRLLGGAARVWDRCLGAGWIKPAIRAGPILYYRYSDIAALAERLCHERPPGLKTVEREEADQP